MSSFKDLLFNQIKEKRNISDNSIKLYIVCLELTNEYINSNRDFENLDFLEKKKKILEGFFLDKTIQFKKRYLSAYITSLDTDYIKNKKLIKYYRKLLIKFNDIILKNEKEHVKSDKQKINMVSNKYLNNVRNQLKKKIELDDNFFLYQDYVISSIYTLFPPRRLIDYSDMKIITDNHFNSLSHNQKFENNYLVIKNKKLIFIFCKYKTFKNYGIQKFEVKGVLKKILNKWIEINSDSTFLFNKDKNMISPNLLGIHITNIFSSVDHPNVSINQIRHSFITNNNVKNNPLISRQMAHSLNLQELYFKD